MLAGQAYWKPVELFSPHYVASPGCRMDQCLDALFTAIRGLGNERLTKRGLRICEPTLQTRCRNLTNLMLMKLS